MKYKDIHTPSLDFLFESHRLNLSPVTSRSPIPAISFFDQFSPEVQRLFLPFLASTSSSADSLQKWLHFLVKKTNDDFMTDISPDESLYSLLPHHQPLNLPPNAIATTIDRLHRARFCTITHLSESQTSSIQAIWVSTKRKPLAAGFSEVLRNAAQNLRGPKNTINSAKPLGTPRTGLILFDLETPYEPL